MWGFSREVFQESFNEILKPIVPPAPVKEDTELKPFDYMVITYKYEYVYSKYLKDTSNYLNPDLDSATTFQGTGTNIDGKYVGCGFSYIVPNSVITNINGNENYYLYQIGDDFDNGLGESILVNFKNLEKSGISGNNNVRVELYAGWCGYNYKPYLNNPDYMTVNIRTYLGGTITNTLQVITSDGKIIDNFDSGSRLAKWGCCTSTPTTDKTHVGTVFYNLKTKVSNIVFY